MLLTLLLFHLLNNQNSLGLTVFNEEKKLKFKKEYGRKDTKLKKMKGRLL